MSARRNAHAFGSTPKIAIPLLGTRRRIHTRGMPEANAGGAEPLVTVNVHFTAFLFAVNACGVPVPWVLVL